MAVKFTKNVLSADMVLSSAQFCLSQCCACLIACCDLTPTSIADSNLDGLGDYKPTTLYVPVTALLSTQTTAAAECQHKPLHRMHCDALLPRTALHEHAGLR